MSAEQIGDVTPFIDALYELKAERDTLLAALHRADRALTYISSHTTSDSLRLLSDDALHNGGPVAIRSAIAKAKAGA